MRIINYFSLILILIFSVVFKSVAQDKIIRGTVTAFDSIRVSKASVKAKSSRQVVFTDSLGNFSVGARNEDVLIVGANGFYNEKVKLAPNIKFVAINLRLKPGTNNKEHAIGYGHVADVDKLNAVSNLDKDDLDFSQYGDIYDIIKGRFSGVRIVDGEVIVRGKNTFDNSSNAALIVVDGVPRDERALSNIPTDQVKSIDIVKDGSTAIYGVQGANGVVIIETRLGSDENKK